MAKDSSFMIKWQPEKEFGSAKKKSRIIQAITTMIQQKKVAVELPADMSVEFLRQEMEVYPEPSIEILKKDAEFLKDPHFTPEPSQIDFPLPLQMIPRDPESPLNNFTEMTTYARQQIQVYLGQEISLDHCLYLQSWIQSFILNGEITESSRIIMDQWKREQVLLVRAWIERRDFTLPEEEPEIPILDPLNPGIIDDWEFISGQLYRKHKYRKYVHLIVQRLVALGYIYHMDKEKCTILVMIHDTEIRLHPHMFSNEPKQYLDIDCPTTGQDLSNLPLPSLDTLETYLKCFFMILYPRANIPMKDSPFEVLF